MRLLIFLLLWVCSENAMTVFNTSNRSFQIYSGNQFYTILAHGCQKITDVLEDGRVLEFYDSSDPFYSKLKHAKMPHYIVYFNILKINDKEQYELILQRKPGIKQTYPSNTSKGEFTREQKILLLIRQNGSVTACLED